MKKTEIKTAVKNKKKKTGPIRYEVIIPSLLFFALIFGYFTVLFDDHLKKGLSWALEKVNGAEVNIQNVKTSFTAASLEIKNIELTDSDKPNENKLQLGSIKFQMLWDALLRGKIVIEDGEMQNIQIHSPRKHTGYVIPPNPVDPNSPSFAKKASKEALDAAAKEFSGNVLGDIAELLQGKNFDTKLKNFEDQLQSKKKLKELESELKQKDQEWKTRLSQMPKEKDFQDLEKKLKSIKNGNFKNLQEVQDSVKQFQTVSEDAKQKIQVVSDSAQVLDKDLKSFDQSVKNLDGLVKQDIKSLEARLKIPSLDAAALSSKLFGPQIHKWLGKADHYISLARRYMPPPKKKGDKNNEGKNENDEIKIKERKKGKTYTFGKLRSYPIFWLKKAVISSKKEHSPLGGDVKGEMTNLSSHPQLLDQPLKFVLNGDFPKQNIHGLDVNLILDHREDEAVESGKFNISSYPIGTTAFSESPEVQVGLQKAIGILNINGQMKGEVLDFKVSNHFRDLAFNVQAKNKDVQGILLGAVRSISLLELLVHIHGPWKTLNWDIRSNLGEALTKAFQNQIKAKVEEAKKQVEAQVNEKISQEKKRLEAEFAKIKGEIDKTIAQKKDEANKAIKEGEAQIKKIEQQTKQEAQQKIQKEGQKALEDLKKQFHF